MPVVALSWLLLPKLDAPIHQELLKNLEMNLRTVGPRTTKKVFVLPVVKGPFSQ